MADFSSTFADLTPKQSGPDFASTFADLVPAKKDIPLKITVRPPQGFVENAIAPITSIPENYNTMRNEAVGRMASGLQDIGAGLTAPTEEGLSLEKAIQGVQQGQDIHEAVAGATPPPNVTPTPFGRFPALAKIAGGFGKTAMGAAEFTASPISAGIRSIVGQPIENITGIPKEYPEFATALALPIPKRIPLPATSGEELGKSLLYNKATRPAPSVGELRTDSRRLYNAPEVTDTMLQPEAAARLADELRLDLAKGRVSDVTAPNVFKLVDRLIPPKGAVGFSVDNLESLRRQLGDVSTPIKDATGKVINAPEIRAAAIARERIDSFLPNVPQSEILAGDPAAASATLKEARANTSAAESADVINRKEFRAELRSAAANSGKNLSNTMRQRVADILLDPSQRRGFSQAELALMETIVRGTKTENALRYTGNFLGGGGGLGALVTTAEGMRALGPIGALAAVPGAALKSLSNVMTARNIDRLNEMVRADSPLARKLAEPIGEWAKAVEDFHAAPSVKGFMRAGAAARSLSEGLGRVGITTKPDDLILGIIKTPAEQGHPDTAE